MSMSNGSDNPFSTGGQSYSQTVSFGEGAAGGTAALGQAAPEDLIKDTTTAGFAADVIQASRQQPVLIDFWAPWCGPCKQLTPIIEKVVLEARGAVKLVKMNIDEHPGVAGQLGIQSIPAVIAFKNGQPVDGFMGAVPESQIKEFINRLTGGNANGLADIVKQADEARLSGDLDLASQLYASILQEDEENLDALVGLASLYFDAGQADASKAILARIPEEAEKKDHPGLASLRAKMQLAEQIAELGDETGLKAKLAADPADHDARFDLSLIENARGNRDAAAEHLLTIMKADREWREDGARVQLLKFFEAWGMTDPSTLAARRKLSALLFR